LNIQTYITGSVIFHIAFLIILGMATVKKDLKPVVFDVDLTDPFEVSKPPVVKKKTLPPVKKPPPVVIPKPKPLPKDVSPEVLEGAGAHEKLKGDEQKDASSQLQKGEQTEGPESPATPGEEGLTLPSGKDGMTVLPPSALFDRKTIQKFARKSAPTQKGLTFDTSEFQYRGYMRLLREKIESIWKYPSEAAKRGISGDLYIRFEIKRDGTLADIELMRTSGYRDLDEAAIKALKDAQPYWPLPDGFEKETLEIKGHFIYIQGQRYIM
jgi:protein TonB